MTAATAPFQLTAEQAEAVGEIIDFDKPWRMGAEVFTGARTSKDRDMVEEVCKILELHGHPAPREWANDSLIELAKSMPPEGQIFHINRHWRLALAEMEYDTMFIRRALMDTVGSYSDYLRLFDKAVAPYLIPAPAATQDSAEDVDAPVGADKCLREPISEARHASKA